MAAAAGVQPGDWFVVDPGSDLFDWVEAAERMAEHLTHPDVHQREGEKWGHAGVATRWVGAVLLCAEAEPGGAVERPWRWEGRPHMWSTRTGLSVPAMGPAAQRYTQPGPWGPHGVPYSFLDYAVIGGHAMGVETDEVTQRLADWHHMICSQLTDQAAQDCGVHLFSDGRPPGLVTPLDLGLLLEAHGVRP